MNDESQAETIQARNSLRRMLIFYAAVIACFLLAYFMGGKALIETSRTAQENERLRLDLESQKNSIASQQGKITSDMQEIANAVSNSKHKQSQDNADTLRQLRDLQKAMDEVEKIMEPLRNVVQQRQLEDSRQKAEVAGAYEIAKQIKSSLDRLKKYVDEWQVESASILTSQVGYQIAGNPQLFAEFVDLQNSLNVDQETIDVYQSRLVKILAPLEEFNTDPNSNSTVNSNHLAYIESIRKPVQQDLEQVELARRRLEQIVKRATSQSPGKTSLADALDNYNDQRDVELHQVQSKAFEKYMIEGAEERGKRLGNAKNALEDSIADERKAELLKQAEESRERTLKTRNETDEKKRRNDAQQTVLDFERDLPEIQSLLTPFITDGKTQPTYPRKGYMLSMFKLCYEKPVSLTAIRGAQLLDPNDPESLERLFFYGGHGNNFRQQGGFPTYSEVALKRNPVVSNKVKRAQELLIKYGQLMVEKGLLLD